MEPLKKVLDHISTVEGDQFEYDENALLAAYNTQKNNPSSIVIKLLSIVGGFLASLPFVGLLLLIGLYESDIGMSILGSILIIAAIVINTEYDKLILDTFSITLYLMGIAILTISLVGHSLGENVIALLMMGIGFAAMVITQNFMLSFISILIINTSFLFLISQNMLDLIHLYMLINAFGFTYLLLKEANIITWSKKLSLLYNPMRIGLLVSLLLGFIFIANGELVAMDIYVYDPWITSILMSSILYYIIHQLITNYGITTLSHKILIYTLSTLIFIATLFAPSILGAIVIMLLCFRVNYRTGFGIGIMALIYFISRYYYDLSFTLLTKSIILFASGILFLACYFLVLKKLDRNEKI